jgi:hypothetical protein
MNEATIKENKEEETRCRLVKLEKFENVPRPNSLVDILSAEFWIGDDKICMMTTRLACN